MIMAHLQGIEVLRHSRPTKTNIGRAKLLLTGVQLYVPEFEALLIFDPMESWVMFGNFSCKYFQRSSLLKYGDAHNLEDLGHTFFDSNLLLSNRHLEIGTDGAPDLAAHCVG